jgi:septal ring factor EnvC (AmiA/AmiB activator)
MRAQGRAFVLQSLAILATFGPSVGNAQADAERELERVQREIAALASELAARIGRRDDGMAELRQIELALAASRAELGALAASIADQLARQAEIGAEQQAVGLRLDSEQQALAEQVRMSYMTGRQEIARLLLSQQNPADVGRMLVYYDYLNRHRGERIATVDAELQQLAALARENEQVGRELARLRAEQEVRLASLEAEQQERGQLLARLDAEIEASGSRIDQMRARETELEETVARLAEALQGFAVNSNDPFAARRGELPLPVEGRVTANFGDKRDQDGLVSWDGMLIEAATGAPVRAIYHGRVIYAQWHTHMGLLLILDHGNGYWSLYGHNSTLARLADDSVRAGDIIAEAGNTGGQEDAALYFSILKDQRAVDPADWLR